MKERPILFSTLMVQALLAGRKTMTRRMVKGELFLTFLGGQEKHVRAIDLKSQLKRIVTDRDHNGKLVFPCPYGEIGDLLWVREAYWKYGHPEVVNLAESMPGIDFGGYRADTVCGDSYYDRVIPGMFMKKDYARIWLEITDISIERVLEISEEDAIAEGVESWPSKHINGNEFRNYLKSDEQGKTFPHSELNARCSFWDLWELINGKDNINANPWVWAISFKILSTNGNPGESDREAVSA